MPRRPRQTLASLPARTRDSIWSAISEKRRRRPGPYGRSGVILAPEQREDMMITGVSIVTVWVLDQDAAKEFYTKKLGFELTNDIQLEGGMRWLTVRSPGSDGQDFLLLDPAHSMLD